MSGRRPQKSFERAFVACHEIVKKKNGAQHRMFLFFPTSPGGTNDQAARRPVLLPLFPE
jgi:hypothetical protein